MIQDKAIASQISTLMLEYGAKLNASASEVQTKVSEEEFHAYRRAIGRIMGVMLLDIMNPIYEKHPELKPPQLD